MDLASRLDPYEQQLLKVFNNHDINKEGSLDRAGLTQLCITLQLEEQSTELVQSVLGEYRRRATFAEFKEALLNLLGHMQNNKVGCDSPIKANGTTLPEVASPDREVCPKYVYGSKKYGRRTRPIGNEEVECRQGSPVQRSNSQSEVLSKKRKTNYKLKRCASLPAHRDLNHIPQSSSTAPEIECTEDTLREAWSKLGVGADGFLNQTELVLVCDAIGLHKLADEVIKQLALNCDRRISFREVLDVVRRDETWTVQPDNQFPDSQTFQYVTLGPDGDGLISADSLVEMWESVGLHSPKELLHELGFDARTIRVADLAEMLEKQTRSISEASARSQYQSPNLTLLQANLTLYQSEIKCFRHILNQLRAEREKLKLDVAEANNRVTLMVQEVDDNHLRTEQATLHQVKLLEQRHADMLRELTAQSGKDKEQMQALNQALEERISTLEVETAKLKSDLLVAQQYSMEAEREAQALNSRISELSKDKAQLLDRVGLLEADKLRISELKRQESEVLLAQLAALQVKNGELKDRNDEMESEIEALTHQVSSMKTNANSGTPTRSFNTLDQSMEEEEEYLEEEEDKTTIIGDACCANRPGPMGACKSFKSSAELPFASSESGFETEPESLSTCDHDEVNRLLAKVAFLQQMLVQHNIPLPSSEDNGLSQRVRELESIISDTKQYVPAWIRPGTAMSRPGLDQESQTDIDAVELTVRRLEEENRELAIKCAELDDCVDLLRNEYEKCEDYWQSKVDEERQFFEAEQKVSGDKLSELLDKMREYEEQYAQQALLDSRLAPIAETDHLEKQFTDLEQEFEEYRASHEEELFRKEEELSVLNGRLGELQLKQAEDEERRVLTKMTTFTSYVIENTCRFPEDMKPASSEPSWASNRDPSTTSQTPCRPKRMRKHDKVVYKKSAPDKDGPSRKGAEPPGSAEQNVVLPLSVFNSLIGRKHHLEQRVRHLQLCMKQQHFHNEQTLQHYWQQFWGERTELQAKLKYCQEKLDQQMRICNEHLDKLQRNDLFVKDLYVENAYLFANVERLEKQCRMLAQASNNCSSSV